MSKTTVAGAKGFYLTKRSEALSNARKNLEARLQPPFNLTEWGNRAHQAYEAQWLPVDPPPHPIGGFDWPEIFRRHRSDWKAMSIVIWTETNRLSGISLVTVQAESVRLEFAEGDPRPDCPLTGLRLPIFLEAAVMYGQGLGRQRIILEPANEELRDLYRDIYGFDVVNPKNGVTYCQREI